MRSAPQKQPSPNIACSRPAGNGGWMRLPLTKCSAGTAKAGLARPGSARSAVGISAFLRRICHMARLLILCPANMAIECPRIEGAPAMIVFFICTGLLGLLAAILTINVGRLRNQKKIFLGDGGDPEMTAAIRAQGNLL